MENVKKYLSYPNTNEIKQVVYNNRQIRSIRSVEISQTNFEFRIFQFV